MRVRDAILRFDRVSSQMSVTQFCHDHQISTTTFYRIRDRGRSQGTGAALQPASRAPHTPARTYGQFTIDAVITTRAQLVKEGLDAGPWSIWWRMDQQHVLPLPSRSTIARILRFTGQVTPDPRKRPRSSWRRFQRSMANELWQLDGMDHPLTEQGPCTIYQVIDDCTRVCVALHAEPGGEGFHGAHATLTQGFTQFGRPAAVLTDNARPFNQHRYGQRAPLEVWLAGQGIRPISGQVKHPQTQGKVERSHQTLDRWLAHHHATTIEQLNATLSDFQHVYNHQRQHQGLGMRVTPMTAWHSVAKAEPADHPLDLDSLYGQPLQLPPPPTTTTLTTRTVPANGTVHWRGHIIRLTTRTIGTDVHLLHADTDLHIYDHQGTLHAVIPWPPPTRTISAVRAPYRVDDGPPTPSQKS